LKEKSKQDRSNREELPKIESNSNEMAAEVHSGAVP